MKRNLYFGGIFLALLTALTAGSVMLQKRAAAEAAGAEAPRFEVDPLWPKPLPNHWVVGMAIGVTVDAQDHIWIVHRTNTFEPMEIYATAKPPAAECCVPAPPVLSSTKKATSSDTGADRAKGMTGRIQITASWWITKATSGLAETAAARTARTFTTTKS